MSAPSRSAGAPHAASSPTVIDLRAELARFLRLHRSQLSAADVGLPAPSPLRRTQGLTRAETAVLAGISVDYYTRIELGRAPKVSAATIEALCGALQLSDSEIDYVTALLTHKPSPSHRRRPPPPALLITRLASLVAGSSPHAALVRGPTATVLAGNDTAAALFEGLFHRRADAPNFARWMLTSTEAKVLYGSTWARVARQESNGLRAALPTHADDVRYLALLEELQTSTPALAAWWEEHSVDRCVEGACTLHHPLVGRLDVRYTTLTLAEPTGCSHRLVLFTSAAGSITRQRMATLSEDRRRPPRDSAVCEAMLCSGPA